MNGTLQILANNVELKTYFIEKHFRLDVNQINPLGFRGRLAEALADFILQMWNGQHRAVEPVNFKTAFTSTTMAPSTKQKDAVLKEDVVKYARVKKNGYVRLGTNHGAINLELYCMKAPKACESFIAHCSKGCYNNTVFHRIIKNFMMQGGDPTGKGTGGESIWKKSFEDEFVTGLSHDTRGILYMANKGSNTNQSQFFVTFRPCKYLDRKHTIFGRVVGGQETLYSIEKIETEDGTDKPKAPVRFLRSEVFIDPFEDAEVQDQNERDEALNKAGLNKHTEASTASKPQAVKSGVGKYINPQSKRPASSDLSMELKKKIVKSSLSDFVGNCFHLFSSQTFLKFFFLMSFIKGCNADNKEAMKELILQADGSAVIITLIVLVLLGIWCFCSKYLFENPLRARVGGCYVSSFVVACVSFIYIERISRISLYMIVSVALSQIPTLFQYLYFFQQFDKIEIQSKYYFAMVVMCIVSLCICLAIGTLLFLNITGSPTKLQVVGAFSLGMLNAAWQQLSGICFDKLFKMGQEQFNRRTAAFNLALAEIRRIRVANERRQERLQRQRRRDQQNSLRGHQDSLRNSSFRHALMDHPNNLEIAAAVMSLPTPLYNLNDAQQSVFAPAEDTFLLLDAFRNDINKLRALNPDLVLEIGCGSGVVSTFVNQALGGKVSSFATDMNPHALDCTLKTGRLNGVNIEVVRTDLESGLNQLEGKVDVLIFNPPHVPTGDDPKNNLERCWAGGISGRGALDRLLPRIPSLLSAKGVFYLVALHANGIPQLLNHSPLLKGAILIVCRCGTDHLCILKFTRVQSSVDEQLSPVS